MKIEEKIVEQNTLIIKQNEIIIKLLSKREPKPKHNIQSIKEQILNKKSS